MHKTKRALAGILICVSCLFCACGPNGEISASIQSVLPDISSAQASSAEVSSGETSQAPEEYASVEALLAQHPDHPPILQQTEIEGYQGRYYLVETKLEVDWLQTDYPLNRYFLVDRQKQTYQQLAMGAGVNELLGITMRNGGALLEFLVYGPYTPGSGQYYVFPRTVKVFWELSQGDWGILSQEDAYLPLQTPARMGDPAAATLALAEIDISFDRVQLVCHGMSSSYEHGMVEAGFDEDTQEMVLRLLSRPGDTPVVQFSQENSLISSVDIRWEETNRKDRQEGVWEIRLGLVDCERMTYHMQVDQTIQVENEQGPELYQAIGIHFSKSRYL